jgi:hypothetical protein
MKNVKFNFLIAAAVLCAAGFFVAGCDQAGGGSTGGGTGTGGGTSSGNGILEFEILTSIEIAQPPDITYYALGQAFTTAGLVVNGIYELRRGTSANYELVEVTARPLPAAQYTVSVPDTGIGGPETVAVRCGSLPAKNFNIFVSNSTSALNSVELTKQPSKLSYQLGEDFDKSGLQITAHYSDSPTVTLNNAACQVRGYDKRKRGTQIVTLRINSMELSPKLSVTVRVPLNAVVTANSIDTAAGYIGWRKGDAGYYRPVYIKGMPMTPANSGLSVNVKANGETVTLSAAGGGITPADTITNYDYSTPGLKQPRLRLDDAVVPLEVYHTDAEPEVYFDYGFMRHNKDKDGKGYSAGKYYVKQGSSLVLSPIRFLIGYGADNNDIGVTSCVWKVGDVEKQSGTKETFTFTPSTTETYTVSVSVTGINFVTGVNVTETATTDVVCFSGKVIDSAGKPLSAPLKNFAPGQFTKGGTGYKWSLGTAGGYEMWPVSASTITIQGNGFENWREPGIIWVQADENGNGIPDEMWYEVTGSQETSIYKSGIRRRFAIKHFAYDGSTTTNEYGQPVGKTFWTDNAGECGVMITGWPDDWGVDHAANGVWVTYTGTIIPLDGDLAGYVDVYNAKERQTVTVDKNKAIRADGTAASIGTIRFVKVQTGVFSYGGPFGDISTEIVRATGIDGDQSGGFPNPLGSRW